MKTIFCSSKIFKKFFFKNIWIFYYKKIFSSIFFRLCQIQKVNQIKYSLVLKKKFIQFFKNTASRL
ncbi:hypothetical protein RIEPE_0303 [Candidatus Riesia pediculicola USDA]|uniref:Uncharacterized protein n=1 Tax=Riesia pediculicola (strain USDA) TaxID=515618 RepID=D4G897_RIEPU|nr:hypothetical protein RIEPE_0303 [Candidatus Riesia pediculicola USDA]ARC53792.1 hypothetical protein AOE55_01345 [Candidatus Riesia pediculicola]